MAFLRRILRPLGRERPRAPEDFDAVAGLYGRPQLSARCATWDLDVLSGVMLYSPEMYELFGLDPTKVTLTREVWFDCVHPADQPVVMAAGARAAATGEPIDCEFRRIHPTLGERWMVAIGRSLTDSTGRTVRRSGIVLDITDRKNAERHQQELATIVASSPDAIVGQTLDGLITSWNAGAERLYGYAVGEVLGRDAGFLAPPELLAEAREMSRRVGGGERIENFPTERVHKSGCRIKVNLAIAPIHDKAGRMIGQAMIARDMTEIAASSLALRESEARFRVMADSAPVLIWMSGLEKEGVYFNKRWLEFTGRTLEQELGSGWYQSVHPEDLARSYAYCLAAFEKHESFSISYRMRRHDGVYRWLFDTGVPRYDESGAFVGYIGSCVDVTESMAAQEALKRSEERLRLALDAGRCGIWDWDIVADVMTWSELMYDFHGVPSDYPVGTFGSFVSLIHPEDRESVGASIEAATKGGESFKAEFRALRPGGGVKWLSTHGEVVLDDAGRAVRMLGATIDVTERKAAEDAIRMTADRAEAASRAKSAFLANMSHEIRTPLGAILGYSELLADEHLTATDRVAFADAMRRNGQLLAAVVDDVLDLSKIEAGKLEVERLPVPIANVLAELDASLRLKADAKGLALVLSVDPDAPTLVHTDPTRLRQILVNVVGNAIKFTTQGHVSVRVIRRVGKIGFVIEDSGPGIDPTSADRLFEPFMQLDTSTTRKYGGTGLGLALSRRLARALGGEVELEPTAPGTGATFVVTIPTDSTCSEEIEPLPPQAFPTPPPSLAGLRILVVDDSLDNRILVQQFLELAGATVEVASNGVEGVSVAQSSHFDAVVMDIQMPEMDGFEATGVLKQAGFAAPILALTAHAMKVERERCLAFGFAAHLTKPIDRSELLRTISTLVRSPRGEAAPVNGIQPF